MVAVVQLVEHQVVILAVAGSSPVSHPRRWEGLLALPPFAFQSQYQCPMGMAPVAASESPHNRSALSGSMA